MSQYATPTTRRTINKRWDNMFDMGGSVSLIERWSDDNYAPSPLPVKHFDTEKNFVIIAELTGFQSEDIHVDLRGDHLIILTSRMSASSDTEQYCEVPLPASVNKNVAVVEFGQDLMSVTFEKHQPGLLYWVRSIGQQLQKLVVPMGQREKGAYSN